MRSLVIARFTFREAIRKRMVLGVLLLSVAFVGLYAFGFHAMRDNYEARLHSSSPMMLGFGVYAGMLEQLGLYVVNFLGGVLAIFAAVGSIASEVDAGTLHAIVPKPIRRWEIVFGKWLGYAAMLAVYVALMCASVFLTGQLIGGYLLDNTGPVTGLVVLVSVLLLSLTVLGSTFFSSVTNGIVVFMLYGVALMGGMVKQVGEFLANTTLTNVGTVVGVLIPSDTLWKLASYLVQNPGVAPLSNTPFGASVPPGDGYVVYALAYVAAAVALSCWAFSQRDL